MFLERRSAAFGSGKRKLDEDITAIEDERESNKENRVDNEEKNTDVVKSTKGISIEQEKESEAYYKVRR